MNVRYVQEDHHMNWYEEQTLQRGHYMLSLCTYGNCVYWVNGNKYIMEKGELLLLPPGCSYYGKSIPTRVHTKQTIGFALSSMEQPETDTNSMVERELGQCQPDDNNSKEKAQFVIRASMDDREAENLLNGFTKTADDNDEVYASIDDARANVYAYDRAKSQTSSDIAEPSTVLPLLHQRQPVHMKPGGYERIHDMLKQIAIQWEERPPYYELMAQSLLLQLLVELNREYDRGMISTDRHRLVDMMKRHIQQHYSTRLGKEQLAEVIQRTPNYAATLFKTITGQTISEYMHHERMKRAVYLLTESQLTVAEIAEFLGYQDVSYFYRIFKKTMGMPPTGLMQDRPPLL
ncbi:AraC family transcriptional regulator [Paenibacillus campi]|uniref:AraC family transcriptional regulator n=1 Tax=Paenibacillus campi TaxID=3106031 RepID=UPI002AFE28FE|nr:AraC family transcriptional regulator [Paenibacillus sp. SGZ-1009]